MTQFKLNISDVISSEKINQLKNIGWTAKEIYDIVNFLMLDDTLNHTKLTTLEGCPTNIKGTLINLPKLTTLKDI